MKLSTLLAVIFCACGIANIEQAEANCPRCVEARENNARNVNPFFYYDDYVDAQQQK